MSTQDSNESRLSAEQSSDSIDTAFVSIDFSTKIMNFIEQEMTGKEFNELFPNVEFVKLTNEYENHNDFQYQDGLNVDIHKFDHNRTCSKGGLYFTTKEKAHIWVCYSYHMMYNIRKVTIPNDARIYIEDNDKFKVDMFILGQKQRIDIDMYVDYIKYSNEREHLVFRMLFRKIQNKKFYLECVKYNGDLLHYVPHTSRDKEICIEAVKQQATIFPCVPINVVDNEFCLEVIKYDCFALVHIPYRLKTLELCTIAVNKNVRMLEYVPDNLKNLL